MPSSRREGLDRGVVLLLGLLVVTLSATGVAARARSGSPDVEGSPGDGGVGAGVLAGVAFDTSAVIVNRTGGPIMLLSATVIPAPGYAAPTGAHPGLIRRPGKTGGERGWPPPDVLAGTVP